MSAPASARDLYLAALQPGEELTARRIAERAGIPDDDPTWLLLSELRRACRDSERCTTELAQAVARAADRIERAATGALPAEPLAAGTAATLGAALAENDHVVNAVTSAISAVEIDAMRAMRTLESAIREFMRRRGHAPLASLVFAFSLGLTSSCLSLWATYTIAISYGQDLGYRAGFHDARIYDRSHP